MSQTKVPPILIKKICTHSGKVAIIVIGMTRFDVCNSCAEDIVEFLQAHIIPDPVEEQRRLEHES